MAEPFLRLRFASPDSTARFAAALAPLLGPGDVILLDGPIGSGKTHFARALIQARLAADRAAPEDVPSPTFTLVQTYDTGQVEIWHADLYRLTHPDEVEELGLTQAFDEAICLVEWPDRLGELVPAGALVMDFSPGEEAEARLVSLSSSSPRWVEKTDSISAEFTHVQRNSPMTAERARVIAGFLSRAGWDGAQRAALAGDASNRRYERLTGGPGKARAVLMDAPPETGEDTRPFLRIARHLSGLGLSAPRILAADETHGLILLEDLGDALFSRVVAADPAREEELYLAATDVLVALHRHPAPEVPAYGPTEMTEIAGLAWDWYGFGATGQRDDTGKAAMQAALAEAFAGLAPWKPVLVLRDYHAENLFWLPERQGTARVGLIDFQDAGLGHPAYDLVSLARDVRRDVAPETARRMMERYTAATGQDPKAFAQAAATLSAQRNLRILGVFARLSMHFGKPHYVDMIPRVWANLAEDLAHPALTRLADTVGASLPEPSPEILATLKDKCATAPTL